jgi:hypothetical protein
MLSGSGGFLYQIDLLMHIKQHDREKIAVVLRIRIWDVKTIQNRIRDPAIRDEHISKSLENIFG